MIPQVNPTLEEFARGVAEIDRRYENAEEIRRRAQMAKPPLTVEDIMAAADPTGAEPGTGKP